MWSGLCVSACTSVCRRTLREGSYACIVYECVSVAIGVCSCLFVGYTFAAWSGGMFREVLSGGTYRCVPMNDV